MGLVLRRPLRYTIIRHSASTRMAIIAIARRSATPPAAPIAAWIAAAAVAAISLAVSEVATVPVVPGLVVGPTVWQVWKNINTTEQFMLPVNLAAI